MDQQNEYQAAEWENWLYIPPVWPYHHLDLHQNLWPAAAVEFGVEFQLQDYQAHADSALYARDISSITYDPLYTFFLLPAADVPLTGGSGYLIPLPLNAEVTMRPLGGQMTVHPLGGELAIPSENLRL